jgi:hypothetical protein
VRSDSRGRLEGRRWSSCWPGVGTNRWRWQREGMGPDGWLLGRRECNWWRRGYFGFGKDYWRWRRNIRWVGRGHCGFWVACWRCLGRIKMRLMCGSNCLKKLKKFIVGPQPCYIILRDGTSASKPQFTSFLSMLSCFALPLLADFVDFKPHLPHSGIAEDPA